MDSSGRWPDDGARSGDAGCGGVWVAHGSGDADSKCAMSAAGSAFHPDDPSYVLRRVWLTKEDEEGYYYGLANIDLVAAMPSGLLPPDFRSRPLGCLSQGERTVRRGRS